MKVVPEDVFTAPLEGASREPQSIAVGRCLIMHNYFQPTIANSRGQVGATPDHTPVTKHCLTALSLLPVRT